MMTAVESRNAIGEEEQIVRSRVRRRKVVRLNSLKRYDTLILPPWTFMIPAIDFPFSSSEPFTDYSRWRLLVNDGGRHTWHYLKSDKECAEWPQNDVDKYWLGIPLVSVFEYLTKFSIHNFFSTSPTCPKPKVQCQLLVTDTLSTNISSHTMDTGPVNMVAPCFSYLV
jgi:hypothetical protein